jgi:hypothetical protein
MMQTFTHSDLTAIQRRIRRKRRNEAWLGYFAIIAVVVGIIAALVAWEYGVGPQGSEQLLTQLGYSHIREVSSSPNILSFSCGRDYSMRFTFTAVNPAGHEVTVHTCDGRMVGATLKN